MDRKIVDVDEIIDDEKELTPLGLACLIGRIYVVEYLIDKGADLDTPSKFGNTPLMLAVCEN